MGGFNYNYKPIDYATAQKQALGQLDPLYQQSLKSLYQNQTQQQNLSGQQAAARGLGHSGLAQDALNKIAIATQGNVSNLNAQRMTQAAQMAQDLVNQDKMYDLQRRGQMYSEYSGDRDYNYNVSRDKVADNQWQTQFNYTKSVDDRNFKYQQGRDKRQDYVTDREWNSLSPAEKEKMKLEYGYSQKLKGSSGGGGGGHHGGHKGGKKGGSSSKKNSSTYQERYIGPSYGDARPTYQSQYVAKEYRTMSPEDYYKAEMDRTNEQRKKAGLKPIRVDSSGRGIEY